ncbi:hypothetical protein SAMN05421806_11340 [Streptomyces indicus]|uniref:PQQ-like domain-containing protein n=2 Tax=Streptomyces indicus TaxID=417292 RepID=A0A1G9FCC4_9ACTN|nr:hypothetical protein SAMN05421806_11340 [Streptomyces indicus]
MRTGAPAETLLAGEQAADGRPAGGPYAPPRPTGPRRPPRRTSRLMLPLALALAAAVPLITAAHDARPTPFGDRLVRHTASGKGEPRLRIEGAAVHAYDPATGRTRWTHTRDGRRPLALLPAPGHAVTVWDDGLVSDTLRDGSAVRWHRAIPGGARWLRAAGGKGVLRALDPQARMVAVVTPQRITAYRSVDGDLRWVLPARRGCAFAPARGVRHQGVWVLAQPCARGADGAAEPAWTQQVVAVDDLGRIAPDRRPMGNALPTEDAESAAAR